MFLEFPAPIVAGEVVVDDVTAAINDAKPEVNSSISYREKAILPSTAKAFGHLGLDYALGLGLPTDEPPELVSVRYDFSTAYPRRPFLNNHHWHVDSFDSLIYYDGPTAEYLVGQLDYEHVPEGILEGCLSGDYNRHVNGLVDLGIYLTDNFNWDANPFPDLSVVQGLPHVPYLLTDEHMHRSPPNWLDVPVDRAMAQLLFKYQ